jgi:hypothetical protein
MIRIRGPTDLPCIDDPDLRSLVELRLSQLQSDEHHDPDFEIFVVEPGENIDRIERAVEFPILTNPIDGTHYGQDDFTPVSDLIESHPTSYELVFNTSDAFGLAVFVPKHPAVDSTLLSMCAAFAVPT